MRINTNMAALNAWRNLTVSGNNMQKSLERLSSGNRINRAADDAAGLAVSEKMNAQIRGINMATRNAQDGISLIQTAEGGASKIQDMLQRMRELAVQSASGSLESDDRSQLQNEFEELAKEINRTAELTKFNNQSLINGTTTGGTPASSFSSTAMTPAAAGTAPKLSGTYTGSADKTLTVQYDSGTSKWQYSTDGTTFTDVDDTTTPISSLGLTIDTTGATNTDTYTATLTAEVAGTTTDASFEIQVGANKGESMTFNLAVLNAKELGITADTNSTAFTAAGTGTTEVTIDSRDQADYTIGVIDQALKDVSSARAKMGAYQNRLDNAVSTLQTQSENLTAAESRIKDVDMASEMAQFTKYQVLQQAGTAMLAQANQLPQGIMSLLR